MKTVVQGRIEIDCGNGYIAVPYDAVTCNGHYIRGLNTEDENYKFALLFPNKRAAMDEMGNRPHLYRTIDECKNDAQTLFEIHK